MAMLMATVLLLCAVPQQAHAAADYSWIKVKLSTNNATVLTMYASGKYFIKESYYKYDKTINSLLSIVKASGVFF